MTQPTASELADLIKSLEPFEGKTIGSLRIGVDEVKLILSALRREEVMRGALEDADATILAVDSELRDLAHSNGKTMRAATAVRDYLSRQALTGEAQ